MKLYNTFKLSLVFLCIILAFWCVCIDNDVYPKYMCEEPIIQEPSLKNKDFIAFILIASERTGLSVELIDAVITIESGGDPKAKSPTGPYGLMQISRFVEKEYKMSRRDPYHNILMGSYYLRDLIIQFGTIEKGLAAYLLGPGGYQLLGFQAAHWHVKKVMKEYRS